MLTPQTAKAFVTQWIQAWNSRDTEKILALYSEKAVCVSPVAVQMLKNPSGEVVGKPAVRAFIQQAFQTIPYLHFELISVMLGVSGVVAYYVNHKGTQTCEYLQLDADGKIERDVATYLA